MQVSPGSHVWLGCYKPFDVAEFAPALCTELSNNGRGRRSPPPPALPPGVPPPPVLTPPGAAILPPGATLPSPPPGLTNGAAPGTGATSQPVQSDTLAGSALPPPPATPAAAAAPSPGAGSNQSAAQLLRARMRAGVKRASPEAEEGAEAPAKKLKNEAGDAVAAAAGAAVSAVAAAAPDSAALAADVQLAAGSDSAAQARAEFAAAAGVKVEDGDAAAMEVVQTEVKTEEDGAETEAAAADGENQVKDEEVRCIHLYCTKQMSSRICPVWLSTLL